MNKEYIFKHTYFIDRALGEKVGEALKKLGVKVEFHNTYFDDDCPDTEWLPIVSQKRWIVLTKDTNIGRRKAEIQAVARSQARVFSLNCGNLKADEMVDIFCKAIEKIDKITMSNSAPFIAKISKYATISLWKNHNELKKSLKPK